jgi:hypothetical protein
LLLDRIDLHAPQSAEQFEVASLRTPAAPRSAASKMPPAVVVARATRLKNMAVAGGLVAFVGGVYQYTYSKMKTVRVRALTRDRTWGLSANAALSVLPL